MYQLRILVIALGLLGTMSCSTVKPKAETPFDKDFYAYFLLHKNIDHYYVGYLTKDQTEREYIQGALYFMFIHWINVRQGHFVEEGWLRRANLLAGLHVSRWPALDAETLDPFSMAQRRQNGLCDRPNPSGFVDCGVPVEVLCDPIRYRAAVRGFVSWLQACELAYAKAAAQAQSPAQ